MNKLFVPDNSYFGSNNKVVETESSVLASSSKFLNSPLMRDWMATYLLRRNGTDRTVSSDNIDLNKALADVLDGDEIDALFEAERKVNPELDRWLGEQFISRSTIDDFRQYPADLLTRSVNWCRISCVCTTFPNFCVRNWPAPPA